MVTKSDRTAVIVLGMHRSGTSALARMLNLLGSDEPATLMVPNASKEKGYFESAKLYQLNTQLLCSATTSWDDWFPMPAEWSEGPRAVEYHHRAVEVLIEEFGEARFFVIKDPRICRLVWFWENVLTEIGATPKYVLTHGNPLEVAASLHKRDSISTGHGMMIWLRHVLDAEIGTRGRLRCFTSFSQLMANWTVVADKIQSELGLSLPQLSVDSEFEVSAFLESSLLHNRENPESVQDDPMLSQWIRDTFDILDRWSVSGEEAEDYGRLDAIRAAFDASALTFSQVIQSGRAEAKRLSAEMEELRAEVTETVNRGRQSASEKLDRERASRLSEEAKAAELDSRVRVQARELCELSRLLARSEAEAKMLRDEVAALRASTSWKITHPLRRLSTRFRRLRQ